MEIVQKSEIIRIVKCDLCGKEHKEDSETYFRIVGNIYIGESGGLIGNNIDEDANKIHTTIMCPKCLFDSLTVSHELKKSLDRVLSEIETGRLFNVEIKPETFVNLINFGTVDME